MIDPKAKVNYSYSSYSLDDHRDSVPKRKASKDGTTVPPAPQITDDAGAVWAFSHEEDHGGYIVVRDGKRMPGTGVTLVWHNGMVCLKNTPGAWFVWDEANYRWGQTVDPLGRLI